MAKVTIGPGGKALIGILGLGLVGFAAWRWKDKIAPDRAQVGAVTSANDSGIWFGTPGSLQLVVREGDEKVEPATLADAAKSGCVAFGAEDGEKEARALSCTTWGSLLRDGKGVDKDPDKARRAFDDFTYSLKRGSPLLLLK